MPLPGLPPQAPPGVGGATSPQSHLGNAAAALPMVRNALEMLQKALPSIPMGSPAHTAVLNAVKNISSHVEEIGSPQGGMDMQSLVQLMKQQAQGGPMQALMRMYPGQQGGPAMPGGGAPGGAPPMPPA